MRRPQFILLAMEIRPLTENDASAWWRLRLIALKDEPHSFAESAEEHEKRSRGQTDDFFRALNAEDFIIGAFENSELAGMAGFYREKHTKFRHKGTIWGVYVRQESRGKGLARDILNEVVRRARMINGLEQILLVVAATQEKPRRLYESLGFRKYGVEPRSLKVSGEYIDDELMILYLHVQ
jgi:ribosomal protein S18 acetylase RimI-like enzyme